MTLSIIRKATPEEIAGARRGQPSMFDDVLPHLTNEWVVIFDGTEERARKISTNGSAKARGIELKRSRGVVLARRAAEPIGQADALCRPRAIDKVDDHR